MKTFYKECGRGLYFGSKNIFIPPPLSENNIFLPLMTCRFSTPIICPFCLNSSLFCIYFTLLKTIFSFFLFPLFLFLSPFFLISPSLSFPLSSFFFDVLCFFLFPLSYFFSEWHWKGYFLIYHLHLECGVPVKIKNCVCEQPLREEGSGSMKSI